MAAIAVAVAVENTVADVSRARSNGAGNVGSFNHFFLALIIFEKKKRKRNKIVQ